MLTAIFVILFLIFLVFAKLAVDFRHFLEICIEFRSVLRRSVNTYNTIVAKYEPKIDEAISSLGKN